MRNVAHGYGRTLHAVRQHPADAYIAKWRMQVASEMLNRGNVNMATIAAEVGYESEAAFRRAFKKMMGVTPSA